MLLIEGLSNAQGRLLPDSNQIGSMCMRENQFIQNVKHVMNNIILGDEEHQIIHQGKLPLADKKTGENLRIGVFNIENYQGWSIMDKVDLLIDKCIIGDEKKCKWKYATLQYKHAMFFFKKKR